MNESDGRGDGRRSTGGTVLIVDDNPNNLRVLGSMLEQAGYRVRPALSGELALRSIQSSLPDLILLDIRMPDLDGYAVCRQLKDDPRTRDLPVIFISALQEVQDKLHAFRAGGLDYVVKPFEMEEVLARVSTHVALRRAQQELQQAYAEMETRVRERTRELQESNERIARQTQVEQTLGEILRLSLSPLALVPYLDEVLNHLARSAPWSNLWRKTAVLLADLRSPGPLLKLVAARNFPPALWQACAVVPHAGCSCGIAAARAELVFSPDGQGPGDTPCVGQHCQGHYAVPIREGDKVLGVLVHFVGQGHERDADEESFLTRVADTLGAGIARRYAEDRIEYLAYHDDLTQLPNRRLLTDRINQELYMARRQIGRAHV
jgi:DNA-binding response OmpR family regulator